MSNAAKQTDIIEGELALAPKDAGPNQGISLSAPATPGDVVSLAIQRGASLAEIKEFMALNREWEADQARKAFVTAMTAFKAEPIAIYKSKRVSFQTAKGNTSYNHAELSDVVDAAITGMAKHGLSHSWDLNQTDGGWIEVTCVVTHSQGHSKSVSLKSQKEDSGTKNSIQAVASAITYLQRYTLLSALGLATKGHDDDGRGAPQAARTQRSADPAPGEDPARDMIVADLYACADNGMDALIAAWQALPEKSRVLVGQEFGQIKKRASGVSA